MTVVACVAVQQHLRLFRDGLGQLLDSQDDIKVVGVARTGDELIDLCRAQEPHAVVLDADLKEWDVARLVTALRRSSPALSIIGLADRTPRTADFARARRCGISALVCRTDGVSEILGAIRNGRHVRPMRPGPARPLGPSHVRGSRQEDDVQLTDRELAVLHLVGAGCTSKDVAERLSISQKTVENHKQRIFRKLRVQNQAHAVSVALRAGLLRPERVIDLALSD